MDLAATQIYEDEDFQPTQTISHISGEDLVQVGTLSINSTEYQIKKGITKIGRLSSNDIVLKDATVSKEHAEIEASGKQGSTWICDLNSSNKTRLNNLILQPARSYELKYGSVIEFGRVRATYRAYCPADDTLIPETPAPSRHQAASRIIPNTPDSSINSIDLDVDGSIILGTQTNEENSIFRRPLVPQQSSMGRKSSSSMSQSANSKIATMLYTSDTDIAENQEVNIFDMETQKFETGHKTVASSSIHDVETQRFSTDAPEHLVQAKASKPLSRPNIRDKITATNIHDVETQNYMDDISDLKSQKSEENIRNVTAKGPSNIHDMETQSYNDDSGRGDAEVQKSESDKQERNSGQIARNIHDLETQRFDDKRVENDISDMETQLEVDSGANTAKDISDLEVQLELSGDANIAEDVSDLEIQLELKGGANAAGDIFNLETQLELNDDGNTVKDISDLETQLESDVIASKTIMDNGQGSKHKDKSNVADVESETNYQNTAGSSRSRSGSLASLNLSSPGVDEDDLSSPLNQSSHLLESTELLDYFGEGIDRQDEVQASKATSTPKPQAQASSKRDNNAENALNVSDNGDENDEDNIFDVPTQRVSRKFEALLSDDSEANKEEALTRKAPREKCETPRSGDIIDDSDETDAEEYIEELAKKQRESSESLSKSGNESVNNRNDPGTSVESEDMFDAPTQRLNNRVANETSDLSSNQLSKINATDDAAPTQIINVGSALDQDDQSDVPSVDISEMELTQIVLPRIACPHSSSASKQNDIDDMAPTQIIDANILKSADTPENFDQEDIDYEMAPTQVIGEVGEGRNSEREKAGGSSNADVSDTIERNLDAMFDDTNSEIIHEPQQMSTQLLEKVLESSQLDNDLSVVAGNAALPDNVPQMNLRKKRRISSDRSRDPLEANANNANNVETQNNDSQNSDIYFSITTRRKRNVIRDTQVLLESVKDLLNADSSWASKPSNEKTEDDSAAAESSKRGSRVSKSKSKSDTLNDDRVSKSISSENQGTQSRRTRQRDEATSKASERALGTDVSTVGVDDVGGGSASGSEICAPCPSKDGQRAQTSNAIGESDDDILTRLPAVRISGTLSNPASPSASSTSTVLSARLKRLARVNRRGKKNVSSKRKSLRKQGVQDSEKDGSPNREPSLLDDHSSSPESRKSGKMLDTATSEDSDTDSSYVRLKQIADRMLNNETKRRERPDKRNMQSKSVSGKTKRTHASSDVSKDQNADEPRSLPRADSRETRRSRRNESSRVPQEEVSAENTNKFTKPETKSTVDNRKRDLNATEESAEQTNLKKRKADQVVEKQPISVHTRRRAAKALENISKLPDTTGRQSPKVLQHFAKDSSGNYSMKSSNVSKAVSNIASRESQKAALSLKTDESIDSGRSTVTRTKRKINERQATTSNDVTADESSNKYKRAQTGGKEAEISQTKDRVLKIVLNPIKNPVRSPVRGASQEVAMIMGSIPSNVHDKNLSIREKSNANIFRRESRMTRGRKRASAHVETDSTESSVASSDLGDTDELGMPDQSLGSAPKAKRGRSAKAKSSQKSSVPSPPAQVPKQKEIFKRPTRSSQNSANSVLDSESLTDSQTSTDSNVSSSSRVSRSKAAGVNKRGRSREVKPNTRGTTDDSPTSRMITSVETASVVSASPRTRRSTLGNSTPSAMRHRVLFTGITEDYGNIVKKLGGSKVEDPANCTVLVTDKVRRTYKFLCALAQGVPIVAINWLRDSESAARFLDWKSYILKDPAAEAKFGFRLRKSLDKAKEKRLLDGYTVVLTPGVAPPPIEELKNMVVSCGGKVLLRPPTKWPDQAMIVSREEDLPSARKFFAKAPKTITVQSTEFILTGILRQETDFDKYRLT